MRNSSSVRSIILTAGIDAERDIITDVITIQGEK